MKCNKLLAVLANTIRDNPAAANYDVAVWVRYPVGKQAINLQDTWAPDCDSSEEFMSFELEVTP